MSAPCTRTLGIVETTTGTSTMREYHLPPVGSYRVEGEVVVEESRTLPVAAEVDVVVAGAQRLPGRHGDSRPDGHLEHEPGEHDRVRP
jgi:hypothetical protein